jgi:hypothetical protein
LPGWLIEVDGHKLKLKLFYSAKKERSAKLATSRKAEAGRAASGRKYHIWVCFCRLSD